MFEVAVGIIMKASLSNCVPEGIPIPDCCMYNGELSLMTGHFSILVLKLSDTWSSTNHEQTKKILQEQVV